MFRAQLQVNAQLNLFLKRSLQEARDRKLLKGQVLAQAVDTRPIFGRGAVEDTYNLIGHAMHTLVRALCAKSGASPAAFATKHGMQRLDAPSLKGAIDIDWSDECARDAALSQLVTDARKLLGLVTGDDKKIENAAILLKQILLQDVDETKDPDDDSDQATLKKGTARGRVPSVTDSQQRHGRKSAAKRFTGHKASVSADLETGLILAVDVLAGDAPDATDVIELTKQAEENSQAAVTQTFGDCAYGSGATRHQFEEAGRELLAKVPAEPKGKLFSKSAFCIQLPSEATSLDDALVFCPAGAHALRHTTEADGGVSFYFDDYCTNCPRSASSRERVSFRRLPRDANRCASGSSSRTVWRGWRSLALVKHASSGAKRRASNS